MSLGRSMFLGVGMALGRARICRRFWEVEGSEGTRYRKPLLESSLEKEVSQIPPGKPLGNVISWMGYSDPWGELLKQKNWGSPLPLLPHLELRTGVFPPWIYPRGEKKLEIPNEFQVSQGKSWLHENHNEQAGKILQVGKYGMICMELQILNGCKDDLHGLRSILREMRWMGS